MMKNPIFHFAVIAILLTSGCAKEFTPLFEKAKEDARHRRYIPAIDKIQLALPYWRESDGKEKKGEAYELLGKCYLSINKPNEAMKAFQNALKYSTNAFDSAFQLGQLYMGIGDYKQAKAAFQKALNIKKDDPKALLGLGDSFLLLDDPLQAKACYQRILQVSPAVEDALHNLELISQKKYPRKRK